MLWKPLCLGGAILATLLGVFAEMSDGAEKQAEQYVKVEIKGKLQTGVVAIGGETTGVVVKAGGMTWELDLGKNEELRKLAEQLSGTTVILTGTYSVRKGVEIPQRHIVTVTTLKPAGK